jgi:2-iminobutanoate/2-iminopropanoate deaminase
MKLIAVQPVGGPEVKGPYSPAVVCGNLVFVSGQGPVDPNTGAMVRGAAPEEFKVAINNVRIILEAAGSSLRNVLKVTLYLADMEDFQAVNEAYRQSFTPPFPARTTIQAARLPFDIKVEIDVVAHRD